MIISVWLLGIAMKTLPVGTAYSIWVGVGAVGTVVLGIVLLGEPANFNRLVSTGLIVAGLIGLKLARKTKNGCVSHLLKYPCIGLQSRLPS
jgi:quaternary ammonium compound-resistance protein SugE